MKHHDPQDRLRSALVQAPQRGPEIDQSLESPAWSNQARVRSAASPRAMLHSPAPALGNQARARLAQRSELRPLVPTSGAVQAKSLRVGATDTPLEREADAVADAHLRGRAHPPISRMSAGIDGGAVPGPDFARDLTRVGGGQPLGEAVRAELEPRFGHDLSPVRIHDGPEAAGLNRRLHARAFTRGTDIFVGAGQPDLGSPAGRRLLTHELTHVVQQQGSAGATLQREGDGTEKPADEPKSKSTAPGPFLILLNRTLNAVDTSRGPEELYARLAEFRAKNLEVTDERCLRLIDLLKTTFETLFALTPTPLEEAIPAEKDREFIADVAKRDKHKHKLDKLMTKKSQLETAVEGSKWYRKLGSKASLARTNRSLLSTVSKNVAAERKLTSTYSNMFGATGSRLEELLAKNAKRVVAEYSEATNLYNEIAANYLKQSEDVMSAIIARRVMHHLGGEVLEHYASISGSPYTG